MKVLKQRFRTTVCIAALMTEATVHLLRSSFSCRLRVLIPRPEIDLEFGFISERHYCGCVHIHCTPSL
jgi:hypothetical protein